MRRIAGFMMLTLVLAGCSDDLVVDPTLAESLHQIGMATTGQVELSQEQWVEIAKEACSSGAHLDPVEAERVALDRGVVFIGTDRPVVETVQVLGEAVCAVNRET